MKRLFALILPMGETMVPLYILYFLLCFFDHFEEFR